MFFEGSLTWSKAKNQKNSRFFVFFMDCSYMYSKHLTKKQKKLEFFLVFCLTSSKTSFKKTKKNKVFFVFKNLNQKKPKKLKENQKKHLLTWNQNFSKKFWFFGFLVFSRFRKNPFLLKEKSSGPPNKTKKTQGKPKKTSFDLKPKLLHKVLVFWLRFFGFLEDSSHIGRTLPLLVKLFCFNSFFLI